MCELHILFVDSIAGAFCGGGRADWRKHFDWFGIGLSIFEKKSGLIVKKWEPANALRFSTVGTWRPMIWE